MNRVGEETDRYATILRISELNDSMVFIYVHNYDFKTYNGDHGPKAKQDNIMGCESI